MCILGLMTFTCFSWKSDLMVYISVPLEVKQILGLMTFTCFSWKSDLVVSISVPLEVSSKRRESYVDHLFCFGGYRNPQSLGWL